jgi:hypothetical protein
MYATLFTLFVAGGCADPFADARKANTVEAWEQYLATNPSGSRKMEANSALEALLVAKANESKKVEDYDAVLKRFPTTRQKKKMQEGRANAAFTVAETTDTLDGWKAFLDQNDFADSGLKKKARGRVAVAEYKDKLGMTEPVTAQVNLAGDPKGPQDGWGFKTTVTNNGDKTIEYLNLEVQYLDAEGKKVGGASWPLVAQAGPGGMPVAEEAMKPFAPAESRNYEYTTGDVPEGWAQKARIVPIAIRFTDASKDEAKAEK